MDADKKKALDMAMHQIEKDFGKGSIMMLGEASAKMNIEVIPTGALSLDIRSEEHTSELPVTEQSRMPSSA